MICLCSRTWHNRTYQNRTQPYRTPLCTLARSLALQTCHDIESAMFARKHVLPPTPKVAERTNNNSPIRACCIYTASQKGPFLPRHAVSQHPPNSGSEPIRSVSLCLCRPADAASMKFGVRYCVRRASGSPTSVEGWVRPCNVCVSLGALLQDCTTVVYCHDILGLEREIFKNRTHVFKIFSDLPRGMLSG